MDIARETKEIGRGAGPGAVECGGTVEVAIYENEIPDFVGPELERLYETVYCTLARFRIYGEELGASTYVARSGGAIACLILFRIEGSVARVVNQQITLSAADLRSFAAAVFARYRRVRRISFYAIDARLGRFAYPFQMVEALEENVLRLPASREQYTASVSQNLMKRLQSAERKLKRDFPGYRFEMLRGTEVTEEILRKVVSLADARMASKQQDGYIRDGDIASILKLIHVYGYAGVLLINGEIRGGNVFYGVGKRFFMHIIAHDPDYDKYMLGHMVQYLAACYCIDLGGRECCLMGGGRENKGRFGAHPMYLSSVDIYRSGLHRSLSIGRIWAGAARRAAVRVREAIREMPHASGPDAGLAARCLARLRRWMRPGASK